MVMETDRASLNQLPRADYVNLPEKSSLDSPVNDPVNNCQNLPACEPVNLPQNLPLSDTVNSPQKPILPPN